jgi:hypothetical protein
VGVFTGLQFDSVLLGRQFDAAGNRTQLNVDIGSTVNSTTSYLYHAQDRLTEVLHQVGDTAASADKKSLPVQSSWKS